MEKKCGTCKKYQPIPGGFGVCMWEPAEPAPAWVEKAPLEVITFSPEENYGCAAWVPR